MSTSVVRGMMLRLMGKAAKSHGKRCEYRTLEEVVLNRLGMQYGWFWSPMTSQEPTNAALLINGQLLL